GEREEIGDEPRERIERAARIAQLGGKTAALRRHGDALVQAVATGEVPRIERARERGRVACPARHREGLAAHSLATLLLGGHAVQRLRERREDARAKHAVLASERGKRALEESYPRGIRDAKVRPRFAEPDRRERDGLRIPCPAGGLGRLLELGPGARMIARPAGGVAEREPRSHLERRVGSLEPEHLERSLVVPHAVLETEARDRSIA